MPHISPAERLFLRRLLAEIFSLFHDYAISSLTMAPDFATRRGQLSVRIECFTGPTQSNRLRKERLLKDHQLRLDGKGAKAECEKRLNAILLHAGPSELSLLFVCFQRTIEAIEIHHMEGELGAPINAQAVDAFLDHAGKLNWPIVLEAGAAALLF
jgi:hypothetical protein